MQNYATLCDILQEILLIKLNLYPEYSFNIMIRIFTFYEENYIWCLPEQNSPPSQFQGVALLV